MFKLIVHLTLALVVLAGFLGLAPSSAHAKGSPGKAFGFVEAFPSGLTGEWKLSGLTYTATTDTRFTQGKGPFAIGACVEVRYRSPGGARMAERIRTQQPAKCGKALGQRATGLLQSFPAGLSGDWIIAGVTYLADANTKLETEAGPFAVGACVKVKYLPGSPNRALKIQTEPAGDCN